MTQWHFGWGILVLFGVVGIEMVCRAAWQLMGSTRKYVRPQVTTISPHKRRDQNMVEHVASI